MPTPTPAARALPGLTGTPYRQPTTPGHAERITISRHELERIARLSDADVAALMAEHGILEQLRTAIADTIRDATRRQPHHAR